MAWALWNWATPDQSVGFNDYASTPAGGFAPNSYVVLTDWNTKYFTDDRNEGPYFAGQYTAVLRSSAAQAPNENPAQDFGSAKYAQTGGGPSPTPTPQPTDTPSLTPQPTDTPAPTPIATDTPAPTGTPTPTATDTAAMATGFQQPASLSASSIAQAVADGLATYGLLGDADLGNLPASYAIGNSGHVSSLIAGVPSYELVELRVGGVVKAVALVDDVSGGYAFGELRATLGDVRLPTSSELDGALAANGLHGSASLTWTWTDDPVPPFQPFLTGLDANGRTAFVTPGGVSEQLSVVNGVTPAAN